MQARHPARSAAVVVCSVVAGALLSATVPALAKDAPTDLDEVVVTATRTARTQDQTLASVSVIERADIERLQAASLSELLQRVPGVSLSNNGGPGKATSLFLRGTESDHVLVLVDGVKLGSATSGGAALQDIPVEQIERVEVVRGPFSSLYGSEALGGVIQIFTRQPQSGFAPNFSFGVGSFDSVRTAAGVGARGDAGWLSLQAAHERSEGINAFRGDPSRARPEPYRDPDLDGYRNSSLSLRAGTRIGDAWTLEGNALRAQGSNEYDGSSNNESDSVQQVVGGRVRFAPSQTVTLTLNGGRSADRSDAYLRDRLSGVSFSSRFDSTREQGSLQADLGLGAGMLSLGADWQRERVFSTTSYDLARRISRAAFAQWQQELGKHSLQLSARRDESNQFGGKNTGSALWGWALNDAWRVTASAGSAYKAPTFNELYFPSYGNPRLQPENSRSIELGLRHQGSWGEAALQAFQTRIDDLIAYDSSLVDAAHPFGQPNNIDQARIRGVEASFERELFDTTVRSSATWLDPRNASAGSNHDNLLPRRARQSARIELDRPFGPVDLGLTLAGFGTRYDDVANRRRLGGYALTDLRMTYAMAPGWSLQFAINNVFDRQYETAAFYHQPGRGYFITLRYRPTH